MLPKQALQSMLLQGSACDIIGNSDTFLTANPNCRQFESRTLDATTRPWYADIYRPTVDSAMRWGTGWPDGPIAAVTTSVSSEGYRPGYSAPHRWVTSGMPFTISIGLTAIYRGRAGDLEPLGTIHTDLSIPAVQKFVDISARKTGKAHLSQTTSGKIVASKMWNLERDTEYSSSDGEDWERVKGGVDVNTIKIIGPEEYDPDRDYETLDDVPTFGEARFRSASKTGRSTMNLKRWVATADRSRSMGATRSCTPGSDQIGTSLPVPSPGDRNYAVNCRSDRGH